MRLPLFALLAAFSLAAQNTPDSAWKKLEFLIGKWTASVGPNDTPLGSGQGAFSFESQLNQKIIVRHNVAEYNSGARHDDLMVIYLDTPEETPRAIYFDTEGHVIRYNLKFPAPNSVVFESDGTQAGPRYRLSYQADKGILNGKFEVAPPGTGYKAYMRWTSKRP